MLLNKEEKIKKLKEVLKIVDNELTKKDLVDFISTITTYAKKIKESNEKNFSEKMVYFSDDIGKLKDKFSNELSNLHKKYDSAIDNLVNKENKKVVKKFSDKFQNRIKEVEKVSGNFSKEYKSKLSDVDLNFTNFIKDLNEKLEDANERVEELQNIHVQEGEDIAEKASKLSVDKIEKSIPELGERIRDALELLRGDDRLEMSAIKGLEEEIEKLREELKRKGGGMLIGGLQNAGEGIETPSGTINGTNKEFNVQWKPNYITLNGQTLYEDSGYTLGSTGSQLHVTIDVALVTGDVIRSHYKIV
jgi:hypothetical protein